MQSVANSEVSEAKGAWSGGPALETANLMANIDEILGGVNQYRFFFLFSLLSDLGTMPSIYLQ